MSQERELARSMSGARDLFHLNLIKADPILRLLTAHRGFEDGQIPFSDGWSVFKVFMQLPATSEDGGATFQAYPAESQPDVLEVFFGRQLGERFGMVEPISHFAGILMPHLFAGELKPKEWVKTRVVGLNYVYHPPEAEPDDMDELDLNVEIWSTDFGTLDAFFRKVESSVCFHEACSRVPMAVNFYTQQSETRGESDDS
jgi:hypothetical protein